MANTAALAELGPAYDNGAVITPHDTNPLPLPVANALFVGGAGALHVRFARTQAELTLTGVTAGSLLRLEVDRVYSTGTTATNIAELVVTPGE